MKITLRQLSDVAFILASLAVAIAAIGSLARSRTAVTVNPVRVAVDDRISLSGVDFQPSDRTLLIVANTRCRYCANSLDFYKRISALDARQRRSLRLIVIGGEPSHVLQSYLDQNGLEVEQVVSVDRGSNPSAVAPTLILLNSGGIVRGVWRGQQSTEGEDTILRAVS